MSKETPVLRLARLDEGKRVIDFVNQYFDYKLPHINLPEYFDYYFRGEGGLQFALAELNGELVAAAGYLHTNRQPGSGIWVSVWIAAPGHNGIGLELMNALPELTGAAFVSCNNIRPKTMAFYRFLGWTADRVPHYYRLARQVSYRLARVEKPEFLPVSGDLTLDSVHSVTRLEGLGLPPSPHLPHKDLWYLAHRYFDFPHQRDQVWSASENGCLLAYLVTRAVGPEQGCPVPVLRIVDFIGEDAVLPRLGKAIDQLMQQTGAEYADCYCWGIPAEVFRAAGFCERREGDGAVIPNYLTPPVDDNTEYYFFTSKPENFTLFKADGDQDRPNLKVE